MEDAGLIGPGHEDFWDHGKFFKQLGIRSKSGATIPFDLWTHQRILAEAVKRCYQEQKWLVHVKPRQEGSSTFFTGVVYQHVAYRQGCYGAILAHRKKTAGELNKIARRFWRTTPPAIRTARNPQVRTYLDFPERDSLMTIASVRDDEPLRGDTCQILLATEVSSWLSDNAWTSALNAVPDEDGFVIAESTPKHYEDQLHLLVLESQKPGSRWKMVFVPWTHIAQYSVDPPPGWRPRPDILDYANRFGLTVGQAYWMQVYGLPKCGGSLLRFMAEYPIDIATCFTLTGDPLFNADVIMGWLRQLDGGTNLAEDTRDEVFFGATNPENQHVIIIDPASSWAKKDFFGMSTWDMSDSVLRHEFQGHATAAKIAKKAVDLGYKCRRGNIPALIVVEANGLGEAVLSQLIDTHHYPNVFYRESGDPLNPNSTTSLPGWWSASTTKAAAVSEAQTLIDEHGVTIPSVRLLRQILQYRGQWDRISRGRRDSSGGHFDLAITFFIFAWVRARLAQRGEILGMRAKRNPQQAVEEAWRNIQRTMFGTEGEWNTPWGHHR